MNHATVKITFALLIAACTTAALAHAQSEVGTVAAIVGQLQLRRGTDWQDASIGAPVFVGDRLRTGATDRAKIVFADDSVLDVGPDTELTVDVHIFNPAAHRVQSLLRLAKGKIRAWVSDYYREPRARYEIETPTAVAGVRGTEFIALYNPTAEQTDIVGIEDQVEVVGKLAVIGSAVQVGPRLLTEVKKGRFPTAPRRLDDAELQRYLENLEIAGTGRRDGLDVFHPAAAGRLLGAQDIPAGPPGAEELRVGAPGGSLAGVLSPDVYTNTQPLLDYKQTPPGQVPGGTGSVRVGF